MNFVWPQFFKTEKDSIPLSMNYPVCITVPFQMKSKEEYDLTVNKAKQMSNFTLGGIIGGFVLIVSSNVNGKMIFYLLESYQIIALISQLTSLPMPSKFKITLTFLNYVMNFQITEIEWINALLPSIMNEDQQEIFEDFGEIVTTALIVFTVVLLFQLIGCVLNKFSPDNQRQ